MDIVVSQDSLGHASTQHFRAVKEAARVLKTGGIFVLTDLMRSDTADDAKLAEVRCTSPDVYSIQTSFWTYW